NWADVPFSARSPPRRQNSAVGALAFIWRTTSSNHGRQASLRACRSFTAMNVKSSWAEASAPCRRPGQTPSDNSAPAERRSYWRRVTEAGMSKSTAYQDKRETRALPGREIGQESAEALPGGGHNGKGV